MSFSKKSQFDMILLSRKSGKIISDRARCLKIKRLHIRFCMIYPYSKVAFFEISSKMNYNFKRLKKSILYCIAIKLKSNFLD